MRDVHVSEVRFTPAPQELVPSGLLGWTTFLIDGQLRAEGVAVRRTRQGRITLSYPARDDGWGKRWTYLRPISDTARMSLEGQVLAQLKGLP